MRIKDFFLNPQMAAQRHYEALREFYLSDLSAEKVAHKHGFSPKYFKKLRFEFSQKVNAGINPFFKQPKRGPKKRLTTNETILRIIALRKQNYSITDIKVVLDGEGKIVSLDTIDKILKAEGFAPLPKRTQKERSDIRLPKKLRPPRSVSLEITDEQFSTEANVGPLLFLPIIENFNIIDVIKKSDFPETAEINAVQSVMSFLALKLTGCKRWSHDTAWNMDRALGFFAGLNVLPKATTLSTYSYRTQRSSNTKLLTSLSEIFKDDEIEENEFNLDFKAIPHWGDESVLEKNWSGARSKSIKSLLALIVQSPDTGKLTYTNAEIKHNDQKDAIFDFIDFWKKGRGVSPKMLIFDSKFTTYKNLDKLNQSDHKIFFLTLRRRGKRLVDQAENLPAPNWRKIRINRAAGRRQFIRVNDGICKLRGYQGEVRQVIITDHGRRKPTFLITNDFDLDVREVVKKYSRRWLVEQEIAEQIAFFSLNNPSSSIVVKVDFDLAISLLAHNLYRILAKDLSGFERCTVASIHRKFLDNGATVKTKGIDVFIHLKKKTHLPILLNSPWLRKTTYLSWMKRRINFLPGTSS